MIDCCKIIQSGGTPLRENASFWDNATIPWLTSGEVRKNIIIETENNISETGLQNSSAKWIQEGSTVIALYGATAGQVSLLAIPTTTNQAVCSLTPKENYKYFIYLTMLNCINHMENLATGSAQQNISKGIVEKIPVIIPKESVLKDFDNLGKTLFQIRINNLIESRTLAAIRDALLPKLMAGEIEVGGK
jgi:type I restriction enzyme S subunit